MRSVQPNESASEARPEYSRSVDAVASELTLLAGNITAGMYRWLVLVEEFDAR